MVTFAMNPSGKGVRIRRDGGRRAFRAAWKGHFERTQIQGRSRPSISRPGPTVAAGPAASTRSRSCCRPKATTASTVSRAPTSRTSASVQEQPAQPRVLTSAAGRRFAGETMKFDYSTPAELFMAKRKAARASRSAIAASPPPRRPSDSRSRIFRRCARWAPGCRSATIASTATTSSACTKTPNYPLQRNAAN